MGAAKSALIVALLVVAAFMWMYAIWHANIIHFVEDNGDVSLMALGGGLGMVAGALFISEMTD
jgi:hypothetical protein